MFLRSPYWVTKTRPNLAYIIVKVWVWNGDLTADEPAGATLTLRSTAFDGTAKIDVAEFARDQVEVQFSGTQESNAVWVKTEVTYWDTDGTTTGTDAPVYYTGLDGFSYFEEGVNYNYPFDVLLGSDRVRTLENTSYRIPVLQDRLSSYGLQYWNGFVWIEFHTVAGITPIEDTSDVIRYIDTANGGQYAERVQINYTSGPPDYIYVDYEECTMQGATEIFFVNRYGAMQELVCFGRFDVSLNTMGESYKRNLSQFDGTYSSDRHQQSVLYKNGKISFTINTGFYKQSENDTFTEMFLSEQVWVRVNRESLGLGWMPKTSNTFIVPVNLKSQEFKMKTTRFDKLINYTLNFEAAADRINSVR